MKFHWFAEGTYAGLPDGFSERNSTWVTSPTAVADPERVGETYRMFIRLLQLADRVGFDGLAVNEHHQTPFAMTPSPNLLAASLAATTEHAAIVVIGDSLVNYNPPTRVAEELAYLDCLSGGRIVAGFVVGTPADSAYSYGHCPVEVRDRFHEARELILRAWAEPEPFAFNGRFTKLRYVNVWPRPIQPRPPIWVPGALSMETWDLVTDEEYCYGHLSFSGLNAAKPIVDEYWEFVAGRGGNLNPHRMAFTQMICCSETDDQAVEDYEEAVRYFHRNFAPSQQFVTAPGYNSDRSMKAMLARTAATGLSSEDRQRAARGEMSLWEYDEKGFVIAGSPERVRERVRELVTELRVGQLIACLHMGNLREETSSKNTTLFGREVAPYLRDIWASEEDRWTPQSTHHKAEVPA